MGKAAGPFIAGIFTGDFGHPPAEGDIVAKPINQPRLQRRLCRIAPGRRDPGRRIAGDQRDIGFRARADNIGAPAVPQLAVERGACQT